jgi:hypothetical protein
MNTEPHEVHQAPYVPETQEVALTQVQESPSVTLFGTDDPDQIIERAAAKATALTKVIKAKGLAVSIQGREHVKIEGWTLCGSLMGVFAVPVWTRMIGENHGWEARVEARTIHGAIVGAAEAQCTRDEAQWSLTPKGRDGRSLQPRDDFALRSMAQTRASAKALRLPLGFIVTLAGYEATPAEEMIAEKDLRPALEASIEAVKAKKAAEAPPLSDATKEMLEIARKNREREQAKLDERGPVDRQKLAAAGFKVSEEPERSAKCRKCGAEVKTYTAKAGHRFDQCSAARGNPTVYDEGGHTYNRLKD